MQEGLKVAEEAESKVLGDRQWIQSDSYLVFAFTAPLSLKALPVGFSSTPGAVEKQRRASMDLQWASEASPRSTLPAGSRS